MAETKPVEEQEPNPYNAKKSWHVPDGKLPDNADGLFFAPAGEQATPSEKSETPPEKSKGVNYKKKG